MKKIAFIIGTLNMGGAEKLVVELAKSFNNEKYRAIVVTIKSKGVLENDLEKHGIKVYNLNSKFKFSISTLLKLIKILKDENVHIINSHSFNSHFYGTIGAQIIGIKSFHTEHSVIDNKRKYQIVISRFIHKLNDKIVTVSEEVYNSLIKFNKYDKNKCININNGVDLNYFNSNISENVKLSLLNELNLKPNQFILITVAAFRPEKNHMNFIKSISQLLKKHDNLIYLLVGDGPLKNECTKLVEQLKLTNKIKFLGIRKDINELLSISDIFILPSKYEGLPLSILESMACGTPVISTNVGGINQAIQDGFNGYLVEESKIDLIEDRVYSLLKNEKLLNFFKNNSVELMNDKYSFKKTIESYEEIFKIK